MSGFGRLFDRYAYLEKVFVSLKAGRNGGLS
jgi:hypothetical protein